jgi:hypothetical protein
MRAIRLEPVEGTSRESWGRRRRTDTESTDVHEPSQQLKQAQLAIAELYQENRELRQQLAAKTLEVSTSQGREGNMTWLKRQLREAQDTIIQLHETQMVSEERNVKHFRECEPTMEKVRAALASTEEAERERGSAKASDEPEKAQLVSQEKSSSIKTANETRSMIDRLHFLSLSDVARLCFPASFFLPGVRDSDRYPRRKHTMRSDGISSIAKDRCTLDVRQFEERHCSLAGVIILEAPAMVCSHPPHARTNKRSRDRDQGRYNVWQESDRTLDRPDALSKESIDTSLSNDEILLMTETPQQRRAAMMRPSTVSFYF